MAKKWSPGTAGEKEQKSETRFFIGLGVVVLLIWLCFSVFPLDTHKFWLRTSLFDKIGSAIAVFGAWGYMYACVKSYVDGKHFWKALLILVFGLAWCGGFNFDYFGL